MTRDELSEWLGTQSAQQLYDVVQLVTAALWTRLRTAREAPDRPTLFLHTLLSHLALHTDSVSAGTPIKFLFKHNDAYAEFLTALAALDGWLARRLGRTPTQQEWRAFYRLAASLIVLKVLERHDVPALPHCLYWVGKVPELVEHHFPGYIAANVIKNVLVGRAAPQS